MEGPEFVYKVTTRDHLDASSAAGVLAPMPIDRADGFMHFSTAAQVAETLRLHFAGARDLVLLAVRTADLGPALRYESSRGGALFPHLHGELPISAVVHASPIEVTADGRATLPGWVR